MPRYQVFFTFKGSKVLEAEDERHAQALAECQDFDWWEDHEEEMEVEELPPLKSAQEET